MVSHRSGETEDTFIADLVVGLCTGQVKLNIVRLFRAPSNCSLYKSLFYNFHRSKRVPLVVQSAWQSTTKS